MGKVVKLQLTKPGVKFNHPVISQEATIRAEELSLLATCFEFQAQQERLYKNVNLCIDCSEQVHNLEDSKDYITFTLPDLEFLKKGFEGTAEKRPLTWVYCRELLKQMDNPVEVSIDEETQQE